jgi:hypothetical protein
VFEVSRTELYARICAVHPARRMRPGRHVLEYLNRNDTIDRQGRFEDINISGNHLHIV